MLPWKYIGWRFLGFVLAVLALELYLRSFTTYGQLVVTERSARLGWRMLPDQSRWSREGDVPEIINGHGYRDRDWDPPRRSETGFERDAGLLRVAVLGNSMTYGTSVAIEDTWPRVLERRLSAVLAERSDARRAQVMNFAVQGYTLEQMQRVFEDDVRPFRPDVLILPLVGGDILPMAPAFDEPRLRYRQAWFRTAIRDLLFREAVGKWIPLAKPAPGAAAPDVGGLIGLLRRDPKNAALGRLWTEAGARLNAIERAQEADGGRFLIAVLPTLDELLDPKLLDPTFRLSPWVAERNAARPEAPITLVTVRAEFSAAQENLSRAILKRFEKIENLPQSKKSMRTLPADLVGFDERLFLEQDVGHLSPRGHRLFGDTVFERGHAAGLWD